MLNLALGMPGGWEWLIILAIGLLLFGRRLPEVGRSMGRGIVEFRKGLKGLEDEIEEASNEASPRTKSKPAASLETPDESRRVSHSAPASPVSEPAPPPPEGSEPRTT